MAALPSHGVAIAAATRSKHSQSVGGLPAHIAGRFTELTLCQQTADGDVLRLRPAGAHRLQRRATASTSRARSSRSAPSRAACCGRTRSTSAADGRFVVADAPGGRGRVQFFLASGARLGGFALPGRERPAGHVRRTGPRAASDRSSTPAARSSSASPSAARWSPSLASTACRRARSASCARPDRNRTAMSTWRSTAGSS